MNISWSSEGNLSEKQQRTLTKNSIASFLYQIFVRSPDGQVLLRLAESVHRLIPYAVIRQTLRVSNAATMIYGMTRLLLSKLSVGSITNWIGISNGANEGMNLLQQ